MCSPYQLSSTHPVCGYQKGTPLAIGTPHLAVLRYIVRVAPLFMLLDSPGDTGGPRRYRGDNSPSDLVSQTIAQGWPSRWVAVLCGNNILLLSEVSLLFNFQCISRAFKSCVGLSQCHSP